MEILKKTGDYNLIINQENDFLINLGWEDNMKHFEKEILNEILNPIDNYETVRYLHSPYNGLTENINDKQSDIWYKFYFIDANNTYNNGLDYNLVDITPSENSKMLKQSTESFFRLEFYKTPNNILPNRINRKLVFAKNLSLPIGEKFFYTTLRKLIHIPVFMGNNYKNKENMYLFWFQDDTVLNDTTLSGNTFYMTAKFYNAKNGTTLDFTNSSFGVNHQINEETDMYYKVVIDKTDYSYQIYHMDNNRRGNGYGNAIKFYEKR